MIDRSKTRDTPKMPVAGQGRRFVWDSSRGNHLASVHVRTQQKAGHMNASDLIKIIPKSSCEKGAVHIWHLGEVYLRIGGRMVYLWRAVDAEGEVLDVLVQSKRNKHAALKLMRKLLKKYGFIPDRSITDDLRSYGAAARDLGIDSRHERGRWKNNRAENSHQATRRRERKTQRCQEPGLSAEIPVNPCCRPQHVQRPTPSDSAQTHCALRTAAMNTWRNAVAAA